jgi:hypothetical protein
VIDPQSNAVGSVTATLYDVPPDPSATGSVGGPAVSLDLLVPGQNGRVFFSATAGSTVTVMLSNVTIGSSCCTSAKVGVVKPDGTAAVSMAYFGTSGKTFAFSPSVTGTYWVLVDPQSNAVGSLTVALS